MRQELPATAAGYFGAMAESYDSLIRRAVPRYDEMTARLLEYLPREVESVLELGCGTGNLSLALAHRFPNASLTFVDASPEMLAVTRTRIGESDVELARHPEYIASRFEDLTLPAHAFDVVVSSISLHHVVDKASVYRIVRAAVRDGGTFAFADQIRGEPETNHLVNWEGWLDFCREPGNCTPEEIQSLLDHAAAHDHYTPMSAHFALLSRSGFTAIDCVWRNLMWGIVTAVAG
jgi:ubiquinone/menaquinone biosynthesis C-methylase UbiE